MKYSIVIPTYNHCNDLLIPCVESLIKYTDFSQVELIIVANGCTDNTREYFDTIDVPHKKLLWHDKPLGYTVSTNLGIKEATGDYIVLLNNDTEILPSPRNHWIDTLWKPFIRNEKMALTGTLKLRDHDIKREFIVFCCAMVRREIFTKLGLLDEIFSPGYGEDIDFAMRVERNGYLWKCVDETKFVGGTNRGTFPIWHKNNKTFGEMPEYGNIVVAKNRQILRERYNTEHMKYSIVIPTYNHCSDLLKPCLESIVKYTDLSNVEVIVVANGCTDETREYVTALGSPFKLVWSDAALGYTKATNLGIKEASGQYVILMNNDVALIDQQKNKWLEILEGPFKADEKAGITGPMRFSWNCGGIVREAMAFWLVMIPRKLFNDLGFLDEIFSPGMGEDGDFSIKVSEAGYKLISVPNDDLIEFEEGPKRMPFPIWHKGNGTFADNISHKEAIIERNNKILGYRWGQQSIKDIEVSIVIPTAHNFSNALKPCLEAIFQYTDLSDKEIIVVANGSTEEARDFLNLHADKLKYFWSDTPTGVVRAYNTGIFASRGKYIVTIDDDSILMPQPVDQWINILKKPFIEEDRVGATGPFAHEYEDLGFVLHSGCTMYDAKVLKDIEGFDETFNPGYFSDPDVALRIWKAGWRCVEVPDDRANKKYLNNVFSINFPVVHMGNVQTMDKNKDSALVKRNRELLYARHSKFMITEKLENEYKRHTAMQTSVNQHFGTIRKYANQCDHLTEFGTKTVHATYALLASKPTVLLTYDLAPHKNIWAADAHAKENGVKLGFIEADPLNAEIAPTDLLLIDNNNTYDRLITQLRKHSQKVNKYIICVGSIPGQDRNPIDEFLIKNSSWKIKEVITDGGGLTVLEKSTQITPKVPDKLYSIVIPTYNHCDDLLRPCIESIKKYTDPGCYEIVVVANGCTDGTKEYVESLGQEVKLIWVDEAIGYTKATNLGINASTGEYIVLLNNDTELLPQATNQWLEQLRAPIDTDDTVGLTGPLQLFDNYAGFDVLIFFCVMVKRELFDKIGILDEIFTPGGGEDIDFTVRAKMAGYKAICISDTKYSHEAGTNVGQFPIWHKDNRTFRDISEYSRWIVKRNGLINAKRFNKNIKLNVGSGGIDWPGYLSVDKYDKRAQILMDITKLDFEDGTVDEILASHVFEHLNPYHALDILKDWLRVLKPGGKLAMEMPDLERMCKSFVTASTGERYGIANAIYGSVNTTGEGDPSNITSPHLFGWWPQSLWDHLTNAGYVNIEFMEEKIPHPADNLRVEAIKPMATPTYTKWSVDRGALHRAEPGTYDEIFVNNDYALVDEEVYGATIVDIGANLGMFSLRCAELGAKKILAVEAQPTVYSQGLLKYIAGVDVITPYNYAAWKVSGHTLNIPNNHVGSAISQAGEEVESITLEKLLNDNFIFEDNMILKLDCEGSEFEIIMSAKKNFLRRFKSIHLEIHENLNMDPGYKSAHVITSKLQSCGFNMVSYRNTSNENLTVQKWVRV
jgi:FkbM family methyltransferase